MERARLVEHSDQEPDREIHVNQPTRNDVHDFCGNDVSTTKYSVLTFVPKNLWEQFQRVANLYFLLISLVQIFSGVSPTGKYNTFMTLVVVLIVSGGKEAYEDWRRHQADVAQNGQRVQVLRRKRWLECEWTDVIVGDIIMVEDKEEIPADIVLISTSDSQGNCYIETSNLDGETNLKIRKAPDHTQELQEDAARLGEVSARLDCSVPSMSMLHFEGRLTMDDTRIPLEFGNLALRGCRLRNTKWVTGLVVYTGHETKILLNSTPTRFKQSSLEKTANTMIVVVFLIELLLCVFASAAAGIWHQSYVGTGEKTSWYLQNNQSHSGFAAEAFLTFFILVSNLIPISLYVTMELMKICLSLLIEEDLDMYSSRLDIPAQARTTNLSEELGQVGYVFSDKTGTLTSNVMEFRKCTIAGVVYVDDDMDEGGLTELQEHASKRLFKCDRLSQALTANSTGDEVLFVEILALCHTVIPEAPEGEIVYQASSPDDLALVEAAAAMGVVFTQRTNDTSTLVVHGQEVSFKVLNTLDFSSDRKRMSVVIERPDGGLFLYSKGADTVMFPRLHGHQEHVDALCSQLQEFAADGFRTLCIASKPLDPAEYSAWNLQYQEARGSLTDRAAQMDALMESLERDLGLVGVTAIEDKLQLGVPAAIQSLSEAGIRTWMLTGDKVETAINIGFSCKLLNENMLPLVELTTGNPAELEKGLEKAVREMAASDAKLGEAKASRQWGLVLEGSALATIFDPQHDKLLSMMIQVALRAGAVLGCRLSPMQKAEMVETIQANINTVTLAIGDGANDVSMITSAHVGVGIAGLEGLSAVNSSDYSIAQFRFLVPLLLWHGHNSYRRIAKLILYFFYKNIVFNLPLYFYAITAGWSGQSMYEPWSIMGYNTIFTALPVMCMALMDQDLPKHALLLRPPLYTSGLNGDYFNVYVLICWVLTGIWHSLVILWYIMNAYACITQYYGKDMDIFDMGVVTYTLVILVVTGKLMLEMHYFSWVNNVCITVSIMIWFGWCFTSSLWVALPETYMSIYHLCGTSAFYLTCIGCTLTALLRDFTWKFAKRVYYPAGYHLLQEAIHEGLPLEEVEIYTGKRSGVLRKIFMLQFARFASALRSCLFKSETTHMYHASPSARSRHEHANMA
eukprot:TRINITY_DN5268_c0_g4_i3.p1 TRINITY_DN5268_c0_g4~~TRINITY_DN5268_c0_g4_i3.p1  ORF type:complete len:1137 (-),score=307.52 TRINITY_DN5268_c0_g4_i3:207-3617(-)